MAFLQKKPRVIWVHTKSKRVVAAGTEGAKPRSFRSRKWYGGGLKQFPPGYLHPLFTDKEASRLELDRLVKDWERRAVGLASSETTSAVVPLDQHIIAFANVLRSRSVSTGHVRQTESHLFRLAEVGQFKLLADVTEEAVELALAELRKPKKELPPLPEGKEVFTLAELADVTAVEKSTASIMTRKHRLPAYGVGKARRFPLATALELRRRATAGCGQQTINYYLRDAKSFMAWCERTKRVAANPLKYLRGKSAEHDQRHARRSFTDQEAARILLAARTSDQTFKGLDGLGRYMLYATALGTGFRENELATLTAGRFRLDSETPEVELRGQIAKNHKPTYQPINQELAAELKTYLADKDANELVFGGNWHGKAADMLRVDLDVAEVPYTVEGSEGLLHGDFHALRHTYGSRLQDAGLPLNLCMQLMRHSDPRLTIKRYAKVQKAALSAAIARVPTLSSPVEAESAVAELARLPLEQLLPFATRGIIALTAILEILFSPLSSIPIPPTGGAG